LPKKNKQQQMMEQQLKSFAGSTAGSVVIALGITAVALPYVVQYLVRSAENLALPYAAMLGSKVGDKVAQHAKDTAEALKKKKADEWHEANPDVTTADIDIPAVSGDPYTAYLKEVGLPPSTVLILYGDKRSLSTYELSGEWKYYGTRRINENQYYILLPNRIKLYVKVPRTEPADEHELCRGGYKNIDGVCHGEESFLVPPSPWPGGIFFGQG